MTSQVLAQWAHGLTIADLSENVRHAVVRHLLDGGLVMPSPHNASDTDEPRGRSPMRSAVRPKPGR